MILDWNEYCNTAIQAAAEGAVLLKNEHHALPLLPGSRVAVYGRIQNHYYKSGTGSGGLVNVSKVTGILDALLETPDVTVDSELMQLYRTWEENHPFDEGSGWGTEPFSQTEMPLSAETAAAAARRSPVAIAIIGRSAGEDKDNQDVPGAYRLSETEYEMLKTVRAAHPVLVVLLNTGSIMDMSWEDDIHPDGIVYVWQGGMTGGTGVCRMLTGKVSPSGKLPDTIAFSLQDYPSAKNFGGSTENIYTEDIYVGYRYFETFAPDRVRYPFGFGLSYTTFVLTPGLFQFLPEKQVLEFSVTVTNTGSCTGKETVQLYIQAPQGCLGKPAMVLAAFQKTGEIPPGGTQLIHFTVPFSRFASYDDSGVTGFPSALLLEPGTYTLSAGTSIRNTLAAGTFSLPETLVLEQLTQLAAPEKQFNRIKPSGNSAPYTVTYEPVPVNREPETVRRLAALPQEIPVTSNRGILLKDVARGSATMDDFIAQFSDDDLACIIRGEGMGSPKVTPGTAGAFGGVSDSLKKYGIPCGCCADGPSGMRLDSGVKAFSLPCGTLLAATFNTELVQDLFRFTGMEMGINKVDVLLGPGMNIHRHPLNGRNFEYFSEDPLLSGTMAAAQVRGMHSAGATGTLKHFCCNNQEFKRSEADAVVSERALREIYLKGYEIAVKEAGADAIMTMYGPVNGIWCAGRYDLNTAILRNEWGFKGIVMTDWWAMINDYGGAPAKTNFAAMTRAGNDLYMVCPDAARNDHGDNTLESLAAGTLYRSELQRNAANICSFLIKTRAFKRMTESAEEITVINRPEEDLSFLPEEVKYYTVGDSFELPLDAADTAKGSSIVLAFNTERQGAYEMELTGASDAGNLAQIPVTVFSQGIPAGMFTWNGTGGDWVTQKKKVCINMKYIIIRLYFAQNGLKLRNLKLTFVKDKSQINNPADYMQFN